MSRFDLSILIPARREEWLPRTVEGILACSGERTEVIVALDGEWPETPLEQHPRVTVLYNPEPVGQRAATNQAAAVSEARWVMKTDAHVAFSPGFDEVLMEKMAVPGREDWTIVPKMFNLHAFDWLCRRCAATGTVLDRQERRPPGRIYQGPTRTECPSCGGPMERDVVWQPRPSPETTAMRFDQELRFQYWSGYKRRQRWEDDCAETMSLLGACWMLSRERYHELNISDEAHGSWGQQGTEVACKTWLSGGRLMCCRTAWFAHLFRTQGGDFGFPYPQPGSAVEKARAYSRELWLGGKWPLAKHPLSWLIDRFSPVPDWETRKGIAFYTDNRVPVRLAKKVQSRLRDQHLPIVSASMRPMDKMGVNVVVPGERGPLQMFRQILAALEALEQDVVFLCEHDVMYHPTHFEFTPSRDDVFYYNTNVWKVWPDGFAARTDDCRQTSGLCANRELLLEHYRRRVALVEAEGFSRAMGFEPGTHGRAERVDDHTSATWESEFPNVDVRLDTALTRSKRSPDAFRNKRYAKGWREGTVDDVPGWDNLRDIICREASATDNIIRVEA